MAYTAVDKMESHFNIKLWTGTGSSNAITGIGFAPDVVWIKQRDGTNNHMLADTIRGANNKINPNITSGNDTGTTSLTAFGSDGFTAGTNTEANANGSSYVGWCFKGTGSNTSISQSGSGNGAINACTHRANTTSGFSVIKYTGLNTEISNGQHTKVTHGLGVKPDLIIVKSLDSSTNWIWTHGFNNDNYLQMNETAAASGSQYTGNQNNSDTTHFLVGNENDINKNGDEFLALAFTNIDGFCKSGYFKGNGSSDGSFIYTGFQPQFIIWSHRGAGYDWIMRDTSRDTMNPNEVHLRTNTADAEVNAQDIDILCNGFKHRVTDSSSNENTSTFSYLAIGKTLVGSNNVPVTAV